MTVSAYMHTYIHIYIYIYTHTYTCTYTYSFLFTLHEALFALLLQVEEVQGLCDPNPTEFIDPDAGGPNVVFFWGVQPGRINFSDIDVVEDDFMQNINNGGYQGPPGKMNLSVIPTSQLPGYAQLDTGSRNRTKACWRMFNYHQPRVPVFSQHLPLYFVGYAATDKDAKRLDAWS